MEGLFYPKTGSDNDEIQNQIDMIIAKWNSIPGVQKIRPPKIDPVSQTRKSSKTYTKAKRIIGHCLRGKPQKVFPQSLLEKRPDVPNRVFVVSDFEKAFNAYRYIMKAEVGLSMFLLDTRINREKPTSLFLECLPVREDNPVWTKVLIASYEDELMGRKKINWAPSVKNKFIMAANNLKRTAEAYSKCSNWSVHEWCYQLVRCTKEWVEHFPNNANKDTVSISPGHLKNERLHQEIFPQFLRGRNFVPSQNIDLTPYNTTEVTDTPKEE